MTTIDTRQLLGAWELVEWVRVTPAGETTYPMSDKASGRIIYDAGGLMSAFLMDPAHHRLYQATLPDGRVRQYYAMPWQGYFIWGATAGMLRNLYHLVRTALLR